MNRAIAIGELRGPEEGLTSLAALEAEQLAQLDDYQPYHAARADLLARAGRAGDAATAYDRAIDLTTNPTERTFLVRQRAAAIG
jgi:RNA polymerase sigma-70 factor (ECF subfamily)